jgi:hypothetical protein
MAPGIGEVPSSLPRGLNIVVDPMGRFIGAWALGPEQMNGVQTTGRLF